MDTKFITDADKARYGDFFLHHLKLIGSRRPVVPLYHYTTGSTLIRMIESGQLWATQIGCLNDAKEMLHAIDLLRATIAAELLVSSTDDFKMLLRKMDELLERPRPEVASAFVICFSERRDDLSQWRAYGGTNGGYAIEFDHLRLREAGQKNDGVLVPVMYDDGAKRVIMGDIMKWSKQFFEEGVVNKRAATRDEWIDEFARFWLFNLSFMAPMLKHHSFEAEAEWRFVYWFGEKDVPNMKFLQRQSMITRHLPLSFGDPNANGYTALPITGVMVGPAVHPALSQIGVGDLLKSKGYGKPALPPVTITDIPFRTVH